MFDQAHLLQRLRSKYDDDQLTRKLKQVIGESTLLGSAKLRTLLMVVMRNATTDSPWPVTNNPGAKYGLASREAEGKARNVEIPLLELVRASTAPTTYFPPELIDAGGEVPFLMVDGGVTITTTRRSCSSSRRPESYHLQWPTGTDKMLLVSIGTGTSPKADTELDVSDMHVLYTAKSVPSALMFAALNEQDMLCRVLGNCLHGAPLDRELGDLIGRRGPVEPKLLTYLRYNAELTREWLTANDLAHIRPQDVQALDSIEHLEELQQVGRVVAAQVQAEHFERF